MSKFVLTAVLLFHVSVFGVYTINQALRGNSKAAPASSTPKVEEKPDINIVDIQTNKGFSRVTIMPYAEITEDGTVGLHGKLVDRSLDGRSVWIKVPNGEIREFCVDAGHVFYVASNRMLRVTPKS